MTWGELREGIEFRCGRGGSSLENGGFPVRRETMILARIAVVAEVVPYWRRTKVTDMVVAVTM
jgi:hypothetical protein